MRALILTTFGFLFFSVGSKAQSVVINEFAFGGDSLVDPWVELINTSDASINLSNYFIATDTAKQKFTLPSFLLVPNTPVLIHLSNLDQVIVNEIFVDFSVSDSVDYLYIAKQGDKMGDVLLKKNYPKNKESWGRFPDGSSTKIFFAEQLMSPGQKNTHPGPWKKIATRTEFSPRDSSPDACIVFNDSVWVLGGYRYENGEWFSKSDVWKSGDGVEWLSVNDSPPYYPYCAFVSFKGKMWAFGEKSYNSTNGKQWTEVITSIPLVDGMRTAILNGVLFAVHDRTVFKTSDGTDWEQITDDAPWDSRNWPGLVNLNGMLFFLGGGIGYNTGTDFYYTDVWSSPDGQNWELISGRAPFQEAYWTRFRVFEGKIWAMGGWNYYQIDNGFVGNNNEVWASEDGFNWKKVESEGIWEPRHAILSFTFKDGLYISSGYGTGGVETLYNGVWRFNRIEQEIEIGDTITKTYGDSPFDLADSSSALPLTYSVNDTLIAKLDGKRVYIKHAGEVTVNMQNGGDEKYLAVNKDINLKIAKKQLLISPGNYEVPFADPTPIVSFELNGLVFDDNIESIDTLPHVSTEYTPFSPVGEYPIILNGGSDNDYQIEVSEGNISVISVNQQFSGFPNPIVDSYEIILENYPSNDDRILIYDITGNRLSEFPLFENSNQIVIDFTNYASGIYWFQMFLGGTPISWRVLKR